MSGRIEIVRTDSEPQPWRIRLVAANGEPVASGEPLSSEADARTAACAIATLFGWSEPRLTHGTQEPLQWVLQDAAAWTYRLIDVEFIDERASAEPCS